MRHELGTWDWHRFFCRYIRKESLKSTSQCKLHLWHRLDTLLTFAELQEYLNRCQSRNCRRKWKLKSPSLRTPNIEARTWRHKLWTISESRKSLIHNSFHPANLQDVSTIWSKKLSKNTNDMEVSLITSPTYNDEGFKKMSEWKRERERKTRKRTDGCAKERFRLNKSFETLISNSFPYKFVSFRLSLALTSKSHVTHAK